MKRLILLTAVVVLAVSLAGCGGKLPDNLTTELVFTSSMENDGAFDLYLMSMPSMETKQLTKTAGQNVENVWTDWSVLGDLVFASTRDGNYEIYLAKQDGTGEVRLTENDYFDGYPTFNPEGNTIAFSSAPPPRKGIVTQKDIYLMDINTRKIKQLTSSPDDDIYVRWSPDGTKLTYVSYVLGQPDVFIYDFASGKSYNVTNNPADDIDPVWTPNSQSIVFTSNRVDTVEQIAAQKRTAIYIMNVDGSGVALLIDNPKASVGNPTISPDGRWIAYTFQKFQQFWDRMYIQVRDLKTDKVYTPVKNDFFNRCPVWRPTQMS